MRRVLLVLMLVLVLLVGVVSADTAIIYTTNATDTTLYRLVKNGTFPDLQSGVGTAISGTVIVAGARTEATFDNAIYRGAIVFPSGAALPDNAVVGSAIVGLHRTSSLYTMGDDGISIFGYNYNNAFVSANYSSFASTNLSPYQNLSTMASTYVNWTLNSMGLSNISLIGNTTLGVKCRADNENNAGTFTFVNGSVSQSRLYAGAAETILYPPMLTITYTVPPVASFTSNVTSGTSPLAVQFNDTSTNTPTSWSWKRRNETFLTGEVFSSIQHPEQTFVTGNWSINLTATNGANSNTTPGNYWINTTSFANGTISFISSDVFGTNPVEITDKGSGLIVFVGTTNSKNVSMPDGGYKIQVEPGDLADNFNSPDYGLINFGDMAKKNLVGIILGLSILILVIGIFFWRK